MSEEKQLVLRNATLHEGDVLVPCNPDGTRYIPYVGQQLQRKYTVSHWDDTWLYYEGGNKGEIGWLWPRIIDEGNPTKFKNPAMYIEGRNNECPPILRAGKNHREGVVQGNR